MKRVVLRIGCGAVCAALALTLGCGCALLPPATGVPGAANAAAVQLRPASPAETRYAAELLARLLDMGYMRRIAAARRRMAGMPEGSEKLELLGEITKLETSRKDLQAQVYGNTVG